MLVCVIKCVKIFYILIFIFFICFINVMFIVNLYMKCSDIYVVDCYDILFFFLSINLFGIIKFVFLDFR